MMRLKYLFIVPCLIILASCTKDSNTNDEINSKPSEYSAKSSNASFLESVAIIQGGVEQDTPSGKYALMLEIKDFSGKHSLHDAFMIDGIEYSDNGKFNDKDSNDGIYTSVNLYSLNSTDVEMLEGANSVIVNIAPEFGYRTKLNEYLGAKVSVGVGCNVRISDCPETSWYNECWFGSPCSCIEFYDCYVEVGLST